LNESDEEKEKGKKEGKGGKPFFKRGGLRKRWVAGMTGGMKRGERKEK